jgi:hypothetical protein
MNGGAGGVERLTRCFADWVEGSGFTATMVFERSDLPPGPYTVRSTANVQVLDRGEWGRRLEDEPHDYLYVMPAGLTADRWRRRFERARATTKVLLDLDPRRRFTPLFHVLHWDAPRAAPGPLPSILATPDPRPTIPPGPVPAPEDFLLTVFTPYGDVKGHRHVPELLRGTGKRLVWCWDSVSFVTRRRRYARAIRQRVESARHSNLTLVEGATLPEIYRLYRACAGYVCFSEEETMGFSMLDALALTKPLAARRIGICRAVPGFRPTEDFARPEFGTYPMPETAGFEGLFRELSAGRYHPRPEGA